MWELGVTVSPVDTDDWLTDTRTSYDTIADSYAGQTRAALDGTPYVRAAIRPGRGQYCSP